MDTLKTKLNSKIKVLLINLDRATDRYEKMKSRCEKAGISFERFPAVEGMKYAYSDKEFDEKRFRRRLGKGTNPAEIGCYLSHYKAIERFLESDCEYGLIFEDDAIIKEDFVEIVNRLIELEGWDFVKFNTSHDYGFGSVNVANIFKDYCLYANLFPKTLSAAYIINRKAGESLKKNLLPMTVPYDHEMIMFWKFDIRQYSVFPSPITVNWGDSFIAQKGDKYKKFPFYKRITVLFFRIYTQLLRTMYFYKLLRKVNPKQ